MKLRPKTIHDIKFTLLMMTAPIIGCFTGYGIIQFIENYIIK